MVTLASTKRARTKRKDGSSSHARPVGDARRGHSNARRPAWLRTQGSPDSRRPRPGRRRAYCRGAGRPVPRTPRRARRSCARRTSIQPICNAPSALSVPGAPLSAFWVAALAPKAAIPARHRAAARRAAAYIGARARRPCAHAAARRQSACPGGGCTQAVLQRSAPRAPPCVGVAKRVLTVCMPSGAARHSVRRAVVAAAHLWLQHITPEDHMCGFVQPAAHGTAPGPQCPHKPPRGAMEARAARSGTGKRQAACSSTMCRHLLRCSCAALACVFAHHAVPRGRRAAPA